MTSSNNFKTYSVDEIRNEPPRAYTKWSHWEDALLLRLIKQDKSIDELATIFQRTKGAIRSRVRKLESLEKIDHSGYMMSNHILFEISFDWMPVLRGKNEPYFFPNPLTPLMAKLYKSPAIYRWNIYKDTPLDEKIIYIGEGQQLIPDRIKGYLNPGPSQKTNRRLNTYFHECIQSGYKVLLEVARFGEVTIGNLSFQQDDLENRHFRRFLENMLITYYQRQGYILLNR